MTILAAFLILACNPDDQKQCIHFGDSTFETQSECQEVLDNLTLFWQQHLGEDLPIPLRCEDEAEHT